MSEMVMNMVVTPETNIDHEAGVVSDNSLLSKTSFRWDQTVPIIDLNTGESCSVVVRDISLHDHAIIIDGKPHHILQALSKAE